MKPYIGAKLVVRMARYGCTNRPFYHIVVTWNRHPRDKRIKEQIGFMDPMPNSTGEKVIGLNLDRVRWHMKYGTYFSKPVLKLLGIIGFLPVHPLTLLEAKRVKIRNEQLEKLKKRRMRKTDTINETENKPTDEESDDILDTLKTN